MLSEVKWLIENKAVNKHGVSWYYGQGLFTYDAFKAIHFDSKKDAEKYLKDVLKSKEGLYACDHMLYYNPGIDPVKDFIL